MSQRGLIWLEVKKVWFMFLLPLFSFAYFYSWQNQYFLDQYASYTRNFDSFRISGNAFSIQQLSLYFAGIILLAMLQFDNDVLMFNLSMPLSKKNLFLPKLAVAVTFIMVFLAADLSGFFLVLNKNLLWVQDSFAILDNSATYFRQSVYSFVLESIFRAVDLMSLYLSIVFLISVLRNKIAAAVLGIFFAFLPVAFMSSVQIITHSGYMLTELLVPFTLDTGVYNFTEKVYISLFSDNSVINSYYPQFVVYNFFSASHIMGYLIKLGILISLFITAYHCFNNIKSLESPGFILYPFAEKIFIFATGVYLSLFAASLGSYFYFHDNPAAIHTVRSAICITAFACGLAFGFWIVRFTSGRKKRIKLGTLCMLASCLLLSSCNYTYNTGAATDTVSREDSSQTRLAQFEEETRIILADMQNNITTDEYGNTHSVHILLRTRVSAFTDVLEELFAEYGIAYPASFIHESEENISAEFTLQNKPNIDKTYFTTVEGLNYSYNIVLSQEELTPYYSLHINTNEYEVSVLPTKYENFAENDNFYIDNYYPGNTTILGYRTIDDESYPDYGLEVLYFLKEDSIEKLIIRYFINRLEYGDSGGGINDAEYLDRLDGFLEKYGISDDSGKEAVKQALTDAYVNKTSHRQEQSDIGKLDVSYRNSSNSISQTVELQLLKYK